jgi:hypothetical protein
MIQTLTIIDVKLTVDNLWSDTQYGTLPEIVILEPQRGDIFIKEPYLPTPTSKR